MADDKDQRDVPGCSTGLRAFTRREFLIGTGMFVFLVAEHAAAQPSTPVFTKRNGVVSLSWDNGLERRTWQIDSDWFVAEDGYGHRRRLELLGPQVLNIRGRFAGINIPVNIRILLVWQMNGWALEWYEGDRKAGAISLSDWFAGKEMHFSLSRQSTASSGRTEMVLTGQLTGSVRWPFSLRLRPKGREPVRFSLGQSRGIAESIDVDTYDVLGSDVPQSRLVIPANVASLLPSTALGKVRVTADVLSLDSPTKGWALGKVADNELHLVPQLAKVIVEVVKDSRNDDLIMVWQHRSSGEARLVIGTPDGPQSLFVEEAEFIEVENGRHGVSFGATRHPRLMEGEGFLAVVRGNGNQYFFSDFRKERQLELPLVLQTLHVRGEDKARYDIDFRQYVNEGAFLDRSSIVWDQQAVDGVPARLTLGAPPKPDKDELGNMLHLGSQSALNVSLQVPGARSLSENGPVLRVRRHEDALDLGLMFQDFRLKTNKHNAWLESVPGARRGVRFHPQHLQEEIFEFPDPSGNRKSGSRYVGDDALFIGKGITTKLARTRTSGASRIIFAPEASSSKFGLSVKSLTDWSMLTLAVSKRADLANQPLSEQIQGIDIDVHTERNAAKCLITRSLVAPSPNETALELVTGLVFSPDQSARFRIPGRAPGDSASLWTAQLELQPVKPVSPNPPLPQAKVRAVWATGFTADSLFNVDCGEPSSPLPVLPFETSLTAEQRTEIMMLSSGIGLAALRAVTQAGQDVPWSRVRIPEPAFDYVDKRKTLPGNPALPEVQLEGVMAPAPFARFNARLTAYGADLDAEWTGEPIAPLGDNPFFKLAFKIEKYLQRNSLGSDVLVDVVDKAFLFPYGFRVSLITVIDRRPWKSDDMGAMQPAVPRRFILAKPIDKTFPGIYQPFQGLELPVRHARLAFEISPEIDPSQMKLTDENGVQMKYEGQIFWPKRKGLGTDILFDFIADDTGVRRSVPMLFVDNIAVHHPPTMRLIMDYYNGLKAVPLRTEFHHGGKTVYAVPTNSGDTSFITDHIILKARSRVVAESNKNDADISDAAFVMDAYMEGADEPPFYPVMVEASISVPALDRLMGEPQGLKRVGYVSHYLENGFDSQSNKAELFLCFLDKGLMDLNGKGKVSGGVAQTPTAIAGISRLNAIVGAKSRNPIAGVTLHKQNAPAVGTEDTAPWDLTDTLANRFVPGDFFRDARLLGILKFADVVKAGAMSAQPRLKEIYDYSVAQVGDNVHKVLIEACLTAVHAIDAAMGQAEKALVGFFEDGSDPAWVILSSETTKYPNLEKCYPDLTRRLEALSREFFHAAGLAEFKDMIKCASTIMESWRNLKGAVDAVIANPTPEPVRGVIGKLRVLIDTWQDLLNSVLSIGFEKQLKVYIDSLVKAVLRNCFKVGEPVTLWVFDALFGALRPDRDVNAPPKDPTAAELREQIEQLLADPEKIPSAVLGAPLGRSLTLPLLGLVASLKRIPLTVASGEVDKAVEMASSVLKDLLKLVASSHVLLEAAQANAAALCQTATSPLPELVKLVETCLPTVQDIASAMQVVTYNMDRLDLPGHGQSPVVDEVRRKSATLRAAFQEVAKQFVQIDIERRRFTEGLANNAAQWCQQPGRMAVNVGDLVRSCSVALDAIRFCAEPARQLAQAIEDLPAVSADAARQALHVVRHELAILCYRSTIAVFTKVGTAGVSELKSRFDPLPDEIAKRLSAELDEVLSIGPELTKAAEHFLQLAADDVDLDREFARFAESACMFIARQTSVFSLVTDFTALFGDIQDNVKCLRDELAKTICLPLIDLHTAIRDQADQAIATVKSAPELVLLLSRSVLTRLELVRDAVNEDLKLLVGVPKDAANAAAVLDRWHRGTAALVIAARTLSELFFAVARGQIGALFTLDEARRAIEDVVRRLIPSRVTMSYEWTATLQPVPASSPVFVPAGSGGKDGLVICTRIDVDLLKPQDRSIKVEGELQPFDVHLWGDTIDLVTLQFKDTRFRIDNGGSPTFTTHVHNVKIGDDLKYLQTLGSFLSTNNSGFSLAPSFDPPGIRVGYSLANPIVQLGGLTILNLGFEIFALLPFDGSQAQLGFSLGSAAQPFGIIVAPCYYGGGFISLLTNARDVIRFQIQLEFGAAVAINFGPLRGQGRVTSGFYLDAQGGDRSVFKGFVHAVGEGQIACFGICVNLEVSIEHKNGSMIGASRYEFSFKVGFFELSYRVTATYTFNGEEKSQEAKGIACSNLSMHPFVLAAHDKQLDWGKYRTNFVEAWI